MVKIFFKNLHIEFFFKKILIFLIYSYKFFKSTSKIAGGALFLGAQASLLLVDSHFEGCSALESGGAIAALSADKLKVQRCSFIANTISVSSDRGIKYGSAISISDVSNNKANLIFTECPNPSPMNPECDYETGLNCKCQWIKGKFRQWTVAGHHQLEDTNLFHNSGAQYGGGVYLQDSMLTITRSQLVENHALIGGGAIHIDSGSAKLVLSNTKIAQNDADQGQIYSLASGGVHIENKTLIHLHSEEGGSLMLQHGALVAVSEDSVIQCADNTRFQPGTVLRAAVNTTFQDWALDCRNQLSEKQLRFCQRNFSLRHSCLENFYAVPTPSCKLFPYHQTQYEIVPSSALFDKNIFMENVSALLTEEQARVLCDKFAECLGFDVHSVIDGSALRVFRFASNGRNIDQARVTYASWVSYLKPLPYVSRCQVRNIIYPHTIHYRYAGTTEISYLHSYTIHYMHYTGLQRAAKCWNGVWNTRIGTSSTDAFTTTECPMRRLVSGLQL
jgi:hypothetical protein